MAGREITYTEAAREALAAAMERDPAIFVLGEGIGQRGGNFNTTTGLYDRFGPRRLRDTPICERGFVGLCAGAAMTGTRPVVDFMFVDFLLDAAGELTNQIAKVQYMSGGRLRMPVLLRGCVGIGGGHATHHSGSYYPLFVNVPGLRVAVPASPYDAKGLMAAALSGDDPVIYLEHKSLLGLRGEVPEEDFEVPFGAPASAARAPTSPSSPSAPWCPGACRPATPWPPRGSRWRSSTRAPWPPWIWRRSSPRCARPGSCWWPTSPSAPAASAPRSPPR